MGGKAGKSGGARPGAGRLIRSNRDAPLDTQRSRALKILIIARGWEYTAENVRTIMSELIDAAYEEYERPIVPDAAAEGYIL